MVKRVLIPHFTEGNQYIREIGPAYEKSGFEVVYGREYLFKSETFFDLIHLHWPEAIYRWSVSEPEEKIAASMLDALVKHKSKGTLIVWTALNIEPHDSTSKELDRLVYSEIIKISDLILHHCSHSIELIKNKYSQAEFKRHIVVPRGSYTSIENTITRQDSRKKFGFSELDFVYLHFGYIRVYKGLFNAIFSFWKSKVENKKFLIAGPFMSASGVNSKFDFWLLKLISKLDRRVHFYPHWIDDIEVQYFFNAADCILLTHKQGLNSGVASLALKFGRLVIGPRLGCISEVLNMGLNLLYDPKIKNDLIVAIEKAPSLSRLLVFQKNTEAASLCRWENITHAIVNSFWPVKSTNQ